MSHFFTDTKRPDRGGSGSSGNGSTSGNGSGNSNGWKSMKDALKEAKKMLEKDKTLAKSEDLAEKKPPGSTAIGQMKVLTNVHGIRLPKATVVVYDVTVFAETTTGGRYDMTSPTREDYTLLLRKHVCSQAYAVVSTNKPFNGNKTYYNGRNVLYSLGELEIESGQTFTVRLADYDLQIANFTVVQFALKQASKDSNFALNELESLMKDPRELNRSLLMFIDTATSQTALLSPDRLVQYENHKTYLLQPLLEGFQATDCPDLVEGKYVAIGSKKSAIAVEGPSGTIGDKRIGIALDTSKTAIHFQQNVLSKALLLVPNLLENGVNPADLNFLRSQLRELRAEKRQNGNSFDFKIMDISSQNAREVKFAYEGREVSIQEYYQERYGIELTNPGAPLLITKGKGDSLSYLPMELCYILESQRVKGKQQTAAQVRQMRPVCVIPPTSRVEHNDKNIAALQLNDDKNPFLAGAGIHFVNKPMVLDARILPTPGITFGGGRTASVDPVKMWSLGRKGRFIFPSALKKWVVYLILTDGSTTAREVYEFVSTLIECGASRGMRIPEPRDMRKISVDRESIDRAIAAAVREQCEFILFIQSDDSQLHGVIKEMERKHVIVTQDLTLSTMKNILHRGKWQTMENVVNKLNVKLGGVNYGIVPFQGGTEYLTDGRLFIGFAMSHPDPPTSAERLRGAPCTPTVLGYASNCKKMNYEFIGDYAYQDARRVDNLSMIEQCVARILEHYKKNRECLPKEVVVYRSGVSEGQFSTVLTYEIPLLRRGLVRGGCSEDMKVVFIVASRLHNIRITPFDAKPGDSTMEQNVKPGIVVDSRLVHPKYKEFYLNSHKTVQGTAKTPRYTALVDDLGLSMDDLELMTYTLCYCHQIVNLPTSTPTPLYVAMRYAERGRLVMHERCFADSASTTVGATRSQVKLEAVNADLPLYGTKLADVRVNA